MNSIITAILGALYSWITSVWSCARMVFSVLDVPLMTNCLQLLAVVFLISLIDSLPDRLRKIGRKKKKDDDDEWIMVRRRDHDRTG